MSLKSKILEAIGNSALQRVVEYYRINVLEERLENLRKKLKDV